MTELTRILYDYATRYKLCGSMEDCEQYKESTEIMERSMKKLREKLNDEEKQLLENYIDEQTLIQALDMESSFRAGLSIGLELSRM